MPTSSFLRPVFVGRKPHRWVLWCLEHDNHSCVFHKKGLDGGPFPIPLLKLYLPQFISSF